MKLKSIPKVIYVYIFVFFILPGCDYSYTEDDYTDGSEDNSSTSSMEVEDNNFFYFSYDDSASTAGVELIKDALLDNRYPQESWARTWEFLNYEEFILQDTDSKGIFSIDMGLWQIPDSETYELGVYLAAPSITLEERQNAVITLLVDVSGSMDDSIPYNSGESKVSSLIETVQFGISFLMESLKDGDVVNLISFNTEAETVIQSWPYDSAGVTNFMNQVNSLITGGSTNIENGINKAYEVANETYDATKMNRIIMLTDAVANEGELDPEVISESTSINYQEGIYFSGLGLGEFFDDTFLNELTEEGRGAYFAIVTPHDIKRAFKRRFISLLSIAAKDVQFRLDFPNELLHTVSASEEYSTDPDDVQKTNFSYNTSQFFLEEFKTDTSALNSGSNFTLTITYTDPETQTLVELEYTKTVSELLGQLENSIKDAFMVTMVPRLIRKEITFDDTDPYLRLLKYHDTELSNEYRDLIKKWYVLHDYELVE